MKKRIKEDETLRPRLGQSGTTSEKWELLVSLKRRETESRRLLLAVLVR